MNEEKELRGKTALITGATGLLGGVVAREVAAWGASVCLGYQRRKEAADTLANDLRSAFETKAMTARIDVTEETSIIEAVDATTDEMGSVDVVVACHGIAPRQYIRYTTKEEATAAFNINAVGSLCLLKATAPRMAKRRWGRIISIGSTAMAGGVRYSAYAGSKSALIGIIRSCAAEYARMGVTCNLISPGVVEGSSAATGEDREERLRAYPLGFVPPATVTAALHLLISEAGGAITGQNIVVDGGESIAR